MAVLFLMHEDKRERAFYHDAGECKSRIIYESPEYRRLSFQSGRTLLDTASAAGRSDKHLTLAPAPAWRAGDRRHRKGTTSN